MKNILSLAVALVAGFVLVGCGEPKSVDEFEKMSDDELKNFTKQCKNENYEKEMEQYLTTGKASKRFIECENAFNARDNKNMKKGFIPQGF